MLMYLASFHAESMNIGQNYTPLDLLQDKAVENIVISP